jgi:hypothetical protein
VNQNNDFDKAIREVARGVVEYVQTGKAPLLSVCDDGPLIKEHYSRAIEAVAEVLWRSSMSMSMSGTRSRWPSTACPDGH